MIKSMEKFDFWQNIEKEITALLEAYGEVKCLLSMQMLALSSLQAHPYSLKDRRIYH